MSVDRMIIAKCVCGAEAKVSSPDFHGDGLLWGYCPDCGWSGKPCATEAEAIATWNRVMRPRPKVLRSRKRGSVKTCSACNGDGEVQVSDVDYDDCRACDGTGAVTDRDIRWRPIAECLLDHGEYALVCEGDTVEKAYRSDGGLSWFTDSGERIRPTHFAFLAPPEEP